MTNVIFWQMQEGKWRRHEDICFRALRTPLPTSIKYLAVIHPTLTKDEAHAYAAFISRLFDDGTFTYRAARADPEGRARIMWKLDCKDMTCTQILTRLTAFRYTDEFASIVKAFAALKDTDDEVLFAAFQELHWDVMTGKLKGDFAGPYGDNLAGHGLIYQYGGKKMLEYKPLTIKAFRKGLKVPRDRVQTYFGT